MDFEALIESAPDAVVVTDLDGSIVLVNAQTERLFGFDRRELIGEQVEILVPARFRARHPEFRRRYHEAPHPRPMGIGMELFGLKRNGEEFPVEISLNMVDSEDDSVVSAAIRDVSLQKEAAEELRRAHATLQQQAEELERSNLELRQFAYVVSHDLQTPLRSISGFVQLLEEEYRDLLEDRGRDWIRRTVLATQRMQSLIRDILAYSRIESKVRPFRRIDLHEVVREVLEGLDDAIEESSAAIRCGGLPQILGDRPQMVQLFENLIGNAIKYCGGAVPQIAVTGRDAGSEWIVTVEDNGIGIDPEHRDRIFDVFQRLHRQHEIPGTGIGLAICRRVVTRHGGRIWVESEPGRGSRFRFSVPKTEESDA